MLLRVKRLEINKNKAVDLAFQFNHLLLNPKNLSQSKLSVWQKAESTNSFQQFLKL